MPHYPNHRHLPGLESFTMSPQLAILVPCRPVPVFILGDSCSPRSLCQDFSDHYTGDTSAIYGIFTITILSVNLFILTLLAPIARKNHAVECKIRLFVTQGYSCRAFRMQVNGSVVEPMQGYVLRSATRTRTGFRLSLCKLNKIHPSATVSL